MWARGAPCDPCGAMRVHLRCADRARAPAHQSAVRLAGADTIARSLLRVQQAQQALFGARSRARAGAGAGGRGSRVRAPRPRTQQLRRRTSAVGAVLAFGTASAVGFTGGGASASAGIVSVSQKLGWVLGAVTAFFVLRGEGKTDDDDDDPENGMGVRVQEPVYVRIDEDESEIYRRRGQQGRGDGPYGPY